MLEPGYHDSGIAISSFNQSQSQSLDSTSSEEDSSLKPLLASKTHSLEWMEIAEQMKELQKRMAELDVKVERNSQETESRTETLEASVITQKETVEEIENTSKTLFMFLQENNEEIRNLQLGFHEIGSKSLQKERLLADAFGKLKREMIEEYETVNLELKTKIDILEKELQRATKKQENVILEAMRARLECMICLDIPRVPLYVCPGCSKMLGCLRCCHGLENCPNCRARLPPNRQPLRGLDILCLVLNSEDDLPGSQ